MTTIDEIAAAAADGADPATLYDGVFSGLLGRLGAAAAEERARLTAAKPDEVDQPWAAAIAATVEHVAITFGFTTPAWCDEPAGTLTATAIGGRTHNEWTHALHAAHGAFVRHEVFPNPGTIAAATGGRTPALRGTRGPAAADWAIGAATAIERRMASEGLRAHVYIEMGRTIWFCMRAQGPHRPMGQGALVTAVAAAAGGRPAAEWIARLTAAVEAGGRRRAPVWWDRPHLLVSCR